MVSKYGYITVATLELFASEDFGAIDATYLSDAHIDSKISAAEELVNTYCGKSFTGTIPDGVLYSVKNIASRMIYTWMRERGMKLDKDKVLKSKEPYLTPEIQDLLNIYKTGKIVPIKLHRLYNNNPSVYY